MTLSASKKIINPGDSVSLSWTSKNASAVDGTNLGTSNVNGSLTVAPTFSSDYSITVVGSGVSTSTVHVSVVRDKPRFAVVGDSSSPDVSQIRSELATAGSVSVQATIPSASTFDALVIDPSGSVGPGDTGTISGLLAAGKGVVLVGTAAAKLSTGISGYTTNGSVTDNVLDTSAIGAWFGGVTELDRGLGLGFTGPYTADINLGYFALPLGVTPTSFKYGPGNGDDERLPGAQSGRVAGTAYKTIWDGETTAGFAYAVPGGGRLYWQWHESGFDPASKSQVVAIFRAGALWAAAN